MHKRGITLIELMVVIIVLGILSLIALPNIKNIKSKAALSVALENKNTVQKGVDKYFLEKQELPTTATPTKEVPAQIDWSKLVPPYVRVKPADLNKIYYWIDYNNTVWVSDIDAPQGLVLNADGKSVSWSSVSGAEKYKVGYIEETANTTKGKVVAGKSYKELATITGTSYTSSTDLTGKTVVVSTVSNNFESVPVGTGYTGNTLQGGSGSGKVISNHKPVAVISMTPEQTITTATSITWGYENSTDEDGDQITNAEWVGKQDIYSTEGIYTVKLRVQDSKGNWSDWAEKSLSIINANGIKQIACGASHTMILKTDETLWGFGSNIYGELGIATNVKTTNPNPTITKILDNVKFVAVGNYTTFVIKNDDTLWGFGLNTYGQLGTVTNVKTSNPNYTPIKIMDNAKFVNTNNNNTVVTKNDGTLWGFGLNNFGQLGTAVGVSNSAAYYTPVKITDNVKEASLGNDHLIILKNDDTVWGLGSNHSGQLGVSTNEHTYNSNSALIGIMASVKKISTGSKHTVVLKNDDTLWGFGSNYYGQIGQTNCGTTTANYIPTEIMTNIKDISTKTMQTLIIKNDDTLWGIGYNNYGSLGTTNSGTSNANPTPIKIRDNVKSVISGYYHTFILDNSDTLYSCGYNCYGQLGNSTNNGTSNANPIPTQVTMP